MDKDAIIARLRNDWIKMHRQFRFWYLASYKLRSFILLYATVEDAEERADIDKTLAEDYPTLWEEIQDWRRNPPEEEKPDGKPLQ